jgi:2-oxoglutarate dehydrogenase E1 component
LYPFPAAELQQIVGGFPELHEIIWLQEEPQNMGAWSFIAPQLREIVDPAIPIRYAGRPASASPAEGSLARHTIEQKRIIAEAMQRSVQTPVVSNR